MIHTPLSIEWIFARAVHICDASWFQSSISMLYGRDYLPMSLQAGQRTVPHFLAWRALCWCFGLECTKWPGAHWKLTSRPEASIALTGGQNGIDGPNLFRKRCSKYRDTREKSNARMKDRLDKKSTRVLVGDLRNSYVTNFPVRSVGHNWWLLEAPKHDHDPVVCTSEER